MFAVSGNFERIAFNAASILAPIFRLMNPSLLRRSELDAKNALCRRRIEMIEAASDKLTNASFVGRCNH